MAADRTFVTELATALGMLGGDDVDATIAARPAAMANLGPTEWDRLERLHAEGELAAEFAHGVANGRAFLRAPDALHGRRPRIVEWTGPRRAPGDEVVPADLRVDHVYLVSCKYLSKVLHNASPQRLVDGLLVQGPTDEPGDWYQTVAPAEHQALYASCVGALEARAAGDDPTTEPVAGLGPWPPAVGDLDRELRRDLAGALRPWPAAAVEPYRRLCTAVAEATAARWRRRLTDRNREAVLWRLLRIGSAPYYVLGSSAEGSMRLRVDTPWDWRQRFALRRFEVEAQPGGQPRVRWVGTYRVRATGEDRTVEGHVELRWSHGRFSGPPEAKVYLDTPHPEVPGYHLLSSDPHRDGDPDPDPDPVPVVSEPQADDLAPGAGVLTLFGD